MNTIAILTDFGTKDNYVGTMKGVIHSIAPQAVVIDVTHHIEAQNVRQAAFSLMSSYNYFAPGTTFLVVVDPGVGSTRRPIAVKAGEYVFVAPDNGVLSYVLGDFEKIQPFELTNKALWLPETSATFHGRDVFAPVAAHIASGKALETVGKPIDDIHALPMPELSVSGKRVRGEIMDIDRFGNILTSIGHMRWLSPEKLTLEPHFGENRTPLPIRAREAKVKIHTNEIDSISHAYADTPRGGLIALVGSNGYLEVAVNQGNAASVLDVVIGDHVDLITG